MWKGEESCRIEIDLSKADQYSEHHNKQLQIGNNQTEHSTGSQQEPDDVKIVLDESGNREITLSQNTENIDNRSQQVKNQRKRSQRLKIEAHQTHPLARINYQTAEGIELEV